MTDLLVTRPSNEIALLTLNRPDQLNALTFEMFAELERLAIALEDDRSVRVLVLTGAGRGFCSGLDLDAATALTRMTAAEMSHGQELWARAVSALREIDLPVIAAVNGAAAGAGFSLALAADIRLASPSARFIASFVRIGLSGGDCGTSWALPRIIGFGLASELLLTGRAIDAEEASRIGLVNRVIDHGDLLDAALETAALITSHSPLGVRMTKQVLQANVDAPSLRAAVQLENRTQVLATRSEDMAEALLAFRQKRPPKFVDR